MWSYENQSVKIRVEFDGLYFENKVGVPSIFSHF